MSKRTDAIGDTIAFWSFGLFSMISNAIASECSGFWRDYCSGIAYAAMFASYLFRMLVFLVDEIGSRHDGRRNELRH